MKKTTVMILLAALLLLPVQVFAIDFDPEEVYQSVVVVNTSSSMGSGFAVTPELVVTNAHVIGSSMYIRVTQYDGTKANAMVVKKAEDLDLAVLLISEADLPPLTFATEAPAIGDDVYAVGAPKDIPYTMTRGIVSALNRQVGKEYYLQIDASINSGNSGGPLLNNAGEVLGINTLKLENAEGIGFAIPAEQVVAFIENISYELDDDGKVAAVEAEDSGTKSESTEYDDLMRQYENTKKQNETLRIAVIILSLALFITVLFLARTMVKKKKKNEFDFEIEIEE